ncbi:GNAT family N-acetyltransferase [Streptococcus azizii]|uniref:GNAT family N-acetyltransferase n=1 Tax=Streptococcus azizii TaxID=1579424 RepID=A0AB36JS60_9STRE|nr:MULTISPECIES: GNAT family N-acetyltransferase [Streptococcus]MBF0775868.1 GNAT family N-acetyltransferase [Streptococcus sp. 19428wD3_AN2]ONK27450.1 GNAT family N-acetyltransferase [Streptococcus azizii]ONK28687.1 GNAT family N-acetyltransferase [Streptococcus azizii]ONK29383.1 GNAT family N-acetyltransferase [Streptococcus azizii]TFU83917.1 GNAT family N-acetyltransferase [Streptococcus sp. AN2]
MIVEIEKKDLPLLREMAMQTFRETFGEWIKEADLEYFYTHDLALETLEKEWSHPESAHYFVLYEGEPVGFLKVNWGQAQTEHELESAFEIQRLYVLKSHQGYGLGKALFEFALQEAKKAGFTWAWLGVWEKNVKAQQFYFKYGFERFGQHEYVTGETVDIDWLLKKQLREEK